jgi:hypothetical protein
MEKKELQELPTARIQKLESETPVALSYFVSSKPVGLPEIGSARKADTAQTLANPIQQPVIWPDEWPVYLNTRHWSMF